MHHESRHSISKEMRKTFTYPGTVTDVRHMRESGSCMLYQLIKLFLLFGRIIKARHHPISSIYILEGRPAPSGMNTGKLAERRC